MNKAKLLVLSLILTISFSACSKINVHGPISEKTRTLDAYTQIDIESAVDATITEGAPGTIMVKTHESVFEHVETYVSGEVLHIRYRKGINFKRSPDIHITIPANNLSKIDISGACNVDVASNNQVFNTSAVSIELSGASSFRGSVSVDTTETVSLELSGASSFRGAIYAKTTNVDLGGASEIEILDGSVETLTIDAGGASTFNGKKFTTDILRATLSGGSNTYINVTTEITKANLSGASDLYYTDKDVKVNMSDFEKTGASDIRPMDSF